MIRNPFPSPILIFEIAETIPKGSKGCPAHYIGFVLVFTAPIPLKEHDCIWIDSHNGNVEVIERDGIAIWRAAWLN